MMDLLAAVQSRIQAYQQTGDRSVLDEERVTEARELWNAHFDTERKLPTSVLHAIAWLFWCRYDAGRSEMDLRLAIDLFRSLAEVRPDLVPGPVTAHLHRESDPEEMGRQGVEILSRIDQSSDSYLLDHAIHLLRMSAERVTDPTARSNAYNALSVGLTRRFERYGAAADLDGSIEAGRESVASAVLAGHPGTATALSNLGVSLRMRYQRTGKVEDLDEAIRHGRDAVAASDPGDAAMYRSMLALSLRARGAHTDGLADLNEAVALLRTALGMTLIDNPNLAARIGNLSSVLATRFEYVNDHRDLDEAVEIHRAALRDLPHEHPNRRAIVKSLSAALLTRYQQIGDRASLEEAIAWCRAAAESTVRGTPDRAEALTQLDRVLSERYYRYEDATDLDEAIVAAREAVEGTPESAPQRAGYLSNLCMRLRARYRLRGAVADLHEAVRAGRHSVSLDSLRHTDRAAHLSNLSGAVAALAERTGDRALADEAVDLIRRSVESTPMGHPDRPGRLSNLGIVLRDRWTHDRRREDLDEAVATGVDSVGQARPDDPSRASFLLNSALSLLARFHCDGDTADATAAIDALSAASGIEHAAVSTRLMASRTWASTACETGRWVSAVDAYRRALTDLPMLAWIGLRREDRERLIAKDGTTLASDAVAAALFADGPDAAVELLEQGRAVLWSQALRPHTELVRLSDVDAGLAARVDRIRGEIAVLDRIDSLRQVRR